MRKRKRLNKKISSKNTDQNADRNEIVFAVGKLSPRVIKILRALREKQYKVRVLFTPNANINVEDLFFHSIIEICDSYCLCRCMEELMYELIMSKSYIVHIFSQIGTVEAAAILIQRKELFSKIIFEQYDIANGMYTQIPKVLLETEQYCIENADGICCRGYEYEYLLEKAGIPMQGRIFKFFDYCDISEMETGPEHESELSLCCAGGISTEREDPDLLIACWLDFAEKCAGHQCHVHIYPATWDDKRFEDYIQLAQKNKYFHIHKPVKYKDLKQELSKYDYGITPIRKEFRVKKIDGCYTINKHIYAESNRYYDYLDAGIPIAAAHPMRQAEYLESLGVLVNCAMEEFDFEDLKERRNQMRKNVVRIRKELNIKNHISDLIGFYNSFAQL